MNRDDVEALRVSGLTRDEAAERIHEAYGAARNHRGQLLAQLVIDDLHSYGDWAGDA